MVPVEALTDVSEEGVTIEQGTEKVKGFPPFDAELVPLTANYQREVSDLRLHARPRTLRIRGV